MDFKRWLLKEDPDEVVLGDESLHWMDGITFSLFDNYYVCAKEDREVAHSDLASEVAACRDIIRAGLDGEATPEEVSDCINAADTYMGTNDLIDAHGVPSRRAMELMLLVADSSNSGHIARSAAARVAPDVVHGRIWPDARVVSFWNGNSTVMKNKGHILEFVRMLTGKEKRFRYEVANVMMDYKQFASGSFATKPVVFDPSKVHTMPPSPLKSQMMDAMGLMRSKPVDIRNRTPTEGD